MRVISGILKPVVETLSDEEFGVDPTLTPAISKEVYKKIY